MRSSLPGRRNRASKVAGPEGRAKVLGHATTIVKNFNGGNVSPEQLNELAKLVVNEFGLSFQWWYPLILSIASGASAWFGAYLKKKGENYVTTEDFDKLKDQLRQNTEVTEQVKAAVSTQAWIRQQHWAHREKYYLELLGCVQSLCLLAMNLRIAYEPVAAGALNEDAFSGRLGVLLRQHDDAFLKFVDLSAAVSIFLSDASSNEVQESMETYSRLSREVFPGYELWDAWEKKLHQAKSVLLVEAKRGLVGE